VLPSAAKRPASHVTRGLSRPFLLDTEIFVLQFVCHATARRLPCLANGHAASGEMDDSSIGNPDPSRSATFVHVDALPSCCQVMDMGASIRTRIA
jgi:hypothetical protein